MALVSKKTLGTLHTRSTSLSARSWLSTALTIGSMICRGLGTSKASLSKRSASFGKTAIAKGWHLTAAEMGGAYAAFHGIYNVSPTCAWIVVGVAIIIFVELRGGPK